MIHPKGIYLLLNQSVDDCPRVKRARLERIPQRSLKELDMSCDDCMAREYLIDECPAIN